MIWAKNKRGRALRSRPLVFFAAAVVDVASGVYAVCDQVTQMVPVQMDDIDEVHQLDPVHQIDHKDEHTFPHTT